MLHPLPKPVSAGKAEYRFVREYIDVSFRAEIRKPMIFHHVIGHRGVGKTFHPLRFNVGTIEELVEKFKQEMKERGTPVVRCNWITDLILEYTVQISVSKYRDPSKNMGTYSMRQISIYDLSTTFGSQK